MPLASRTELERLLKEDKLVLSSPERAQASLSANQLPSNSGMQQSAPGQLPMLVIDLDRYVT